MDFYRKNPSPGFRFCAVPVRQFKSDWIQLRFFVPKTAETISDYALLPAVLKRGCEPYPTARDLSRRLDDLYDAQMDLWNDLCGGTVEIFSELRSLEDECLPEPMNLFEEALRTQEALLFRPLRGERGFLPSYVETERNNLIRMIRQSEKHGTYRAISLLRRELWGDGIEAVPAEGTAESAALVTDESLDRSYRAMLERAPVDCVYVGKRDPEEVLERVRTLLEPCLGRRKSGGSLFPYPVFKARIPKPVPTSRTEEFPTAQSTLAITFSGGRVKSSGAGCAEYLFNHLYGGDASSRLFARVRETLHLCYSCSSAYSDRSGILSVVCGIDAEQREAAESAIRDQLAELAGGRFSAGELENAKALQISRLRSVSDRPRRILSWASECLLTEEWVSPEER
ncbi:MAG: insulinase family protein, partial [Clostridia bacterium]|nr:insulinase family protein [Clostridia bacterium]